MLTSLFFITILTIKNYHYTVVQRQKAVTAHFTSKQILPFGCAEQCKKTYVCFIITIPTIKMSSINRHAKPKDSIWLVYKWADTAFGFAEQCKYLTKINAIPHVIIRSTPDQLTFRSCISSLHNMSINCWHFKWESGLCLNVWSYCVTDFISMFTSSARDQ